MSSHKGSTYLVHTVMLKHQQAIAEKYVQTPGFSAEACTKPKNKTDIEKPQNWKAEFLFHFNGPNTL